MIEKTYTVIRNTTTCCSKDICGGIWSDTICQFYYTYKHRSSAYRAYNRERSNLKYPQDHVGLSVDIDGRFKMLKMERMEPDDSVLDIIVLNKNL